MPTATLTIKDEVNVKIEGLDAGTRRHLNKKFKYEIPGARFMPAVRLGRWDGSTAFFSMGGSTYINLLPEILPDLDQRGYEINVNDLRQYHNNYQFDPVTADYLKDYSWPKGHPNEGQPIELRDYQLDAVNSFLSNTQSIQCIATGAGKTLMTATLAKCAGQYGRTILIVPSKNLVTQTEEDYINIGLDVGVYFGDRKELNHQHIISTWQSLNQLLKDSEGRNSEDEPANRRLARDPTDYIIDDIIDGLVCVMVDECHSLKADKLKALMTDVLAQVPIRWAVSGTIPKDEHDFRSLQVSVGEVINRITAAELQDRGVLADCNVNIMQLVDHTEYKTYQSELKYLLEDENRLRYIAQMINNLEGNSLVLIDRVEPGKQLSEFVNNATFLSGATKVKDRKEQYVEVNFSDNKVLIATYGIAAVGINITKLHNLVLIEPGKSFVRVIQSIGRGLRKGFDKDHVEIWDITSTCKFSKRHLTKRKQYYAEADYPYSVEKIHWQ
jgi:superfamily II DNA or RNA helicase